MKDNYLFPFVENKKLESELDKSVDDTHCHFEVEEDMEKAGRGEGSRGGKIIGHTKSGKPIYEGSKKESKKIQTQSFAEYANKDSNFMKEVKKLEEDNLLPDKVIDAIERKADKKEMEKIVIQMRKRHAKWDLQPGSSPLHSSITAGMWSLLGELRKSEESDLEKAKDQFDPKELKMGIEIEKEHTDNPKIAEKIAKDHLKEMPDYYTKLKQMEKEGEAEKSLNKDINDLIKAKYIKREGGPGQYKYTYTEKKGNKKEKTPETPKIESRPDAKEIAETVLQQMGGAKRISLMTGAKNFTYDMEGGLNFQLPRTPKGSYNAFKVNLSPNDTYKMTFIKVGNAPNYKMTKKDVAGVYNDQLMDIFEKETGLYLTMKQRKSLDKDINDLIKGTKVLGETATGKKVLASAFYNPTGDGCDCKMKDCKCKKPRDKNVVPDILDKGKKKVKKAEDERQKEAEREVAREKRQKTVPLLKKQTTSDKEKEKIREKISKEK